MHCANLRLPVQEVVWWQQERQGLEQAQVQGQQLLAQHQLLAAVPELYTRSVLEIERCNRLASLIALLNQTSNHTACSIMLVQRV